MIGPRRTNDFDNFMMPSAKPALSPRQLPLANINNYNSNPTPLKNNLSERHLSPNRISHTRKPMISPSRSPRRQPQRAVARQRHEESSQSNVQEYYCSNESHPHKKAEFFIHIEDEDMYYCGVCATQAASQGFTVKRVGQILESKRVRTLPHCPQHAKNPRFHQICGLLKGISTLESKYHRLDPRQVSEHYRQQEQILNCYYQQMLTLVQKRRNQHLAQLQRQSTQKQQLAICGQQHLKIHMDELSEVWQDIQDNLTEIIVNVDAQNYQNCMNHYNNALQISKHKFQQYGQEMENINSFNQHQLTRKVKEFQEQLQDPLIEEEFQNARTVKHIADPKKTGGTPLDRNKSVKHVHEMLPRSHSHKQIEGKGQEAFRTLFHQEENEQKIPEASPQFKAF